VSDKFQFIQVKLWPIPLIFSASVLIIIAFKLLSLDSLNSRISVYPILCKETVYLNHCERPDYALAKITYHVYKRENEVIYWTEGQKPIRETNCEIRDRLNWHCQSSLSSYEFGFDNGNYWQREKGEEAQKFASFNSKIAFSTKDQWLSLQCKTSSLKSVCKLLAGFFN